MAANNNSVGVKNNDIVWKTFTTDTHYSQLVRKINKIICRTTFTVECENVRIFQRLLKTLPYFPFFYFFPSIVLQWKKLKKSKSKNKLLLFSN